MWAHAYRLLGRSKRTIDAGGYRTYFDCEGGATIAEYYESSGSMTPAWSKSKTYASNFDFSLTDSGATSRVQLGNDRWESVVYNKPPQPTLIGFGSTQNGTELMKLEYNYGTTDNNGKCALADYHHANRSEFGGIHSRAELRL